MAIQHVAGRYVVSIRSRNKVRPILMVDAAETREDAHALENEMVAALRAGHSWPAVQPAKGTLAAVLLDTWGEGGGWYRTQVGGLYYALALDFVTLFEADRRASILNEAVVDRYLYRRDKATVRAVFQFLKVAAESGAVKWRPVRQRDEQNPIKFLHERKTKSHKFIRVKNPGNGALWIKVDVTKSRWE
jgi:hypothetical protein